MGSGGVNEGRTRDADGSAEGWGADASETLPSNAITQHSQITLPHQLRVLDRGVVCFIQFEDSRASRDHDRDDVLEERVSLLIHDEPHQHHGHHLARLGENLGGERDELEGLVLADGGKNVGDGGEGELVERRLRKRVGILG